MGGAFRSFQAGHRAEVALYYVPSACSYYTGAIRAVSQTRHANHVCVCPLPSLCLMRVSEAHISSTRYSPSSAAWRAAHMSHRRPQRYTVSRRENAGAMKTLFHGGGDFARGKSRNDAPSDASFVDFDSPPLDRYRVSFPSFSALSKRCFS